MKRSITQSRCYGFTLIEMVVVITIAGIVGTMATYFMVNVMQGYEDQTRRAELVDAAESALRRMQRDVRRALPNSIRVVNEGNGNGRVLELLQTLDGGRYRVGPPGGAAELLNFTAADTDFDILGNLLCTTNPAVTGPCASYTNYLLVIYNLGQAGADAYTGATHSIALSTPEVDSQGHVTTKQRSLNVRIPKGVRQGQRIRLSGQGTPGLGDGPAGDLYLEIEFRPHPFYRVEGRDVYLDLPVTPWEAALGAKVKVPTPDGTVDLTIPKGSRSGRRLRLKGRGIPSSTPGDLYVLPQITLPPADSEAARSLYRKMAEELPYNPRSKLGV